MADITTRAALKAYILRQLGAPLVQVELDDLQLDDAIDQAILEFSEFAYDGQLEQTAIIQISGPGDYTLPNYITSIIKVSQGAMGLTNFSMNYGAGMVPNILTEMWLSSLTQGVSAGVVGTMITISNMKAQLDKFFGDDLAYDFNPYAKVLRLFQDYQGPIVVHYTHRYVADDLGDDIFNQIWVKKYATALSRLNQSTVVGKYDQTLVGGARINYQDMRALAQEDLQALREELVETWAGSAPIFIG